MKAQLFDELVKIRKQNMKIESKERVDKLVELEQQYEEKKDEELEVLRKKY